MRSRMKTSICKGCGRLIGWIRTTGGKAMPVDPDKVFYWQSAAGQNKIVTPRGEIVSAHLDGPSEACTGQGYISHWATCPQAEAFRR